MADFIDNLVRKAAGLPFMTEPEPPSIPRFKISPDSLIVAEKKPQGDTIGGSRAIFEEGPAKVSEDTTDLSIGTDKNKSPESSSILSTASFESLTYEGRTALATDKETVVSRTRVPELKPSEQGSPLTMLKPTAHVDQESRSAKESVDSKIQTPGSDTSEPGLSSNLLKPRTQVVQESLKGAAESHDRHIAVGKKSAAFRPSFVPSQVQEVSKKNKAGDDIVVAVEPLTEAPNQMQIKKLMSRRSLTQPYTNGEAKSAQASQDKKEVRVNIGRIEIKASQQASSPSNPPVRGFENYLMMRVYLDRHYF